MKRLIVLLSAVLLVLAAAPLFAQDIVLTIAVPEFINSSLDEAVFDDFEAQNPGVQVVLKSSGDSGNYPAASTNLDEHLQGVAEYVALADILYVNAANLSPEASRAGFVLDLAPLVAGDSSLAQEDFLPAAWQSFQWDRGVWAIPISVDVLLMIYDPQAFDEAGLAYPNEAWTIDDLAAADDALAERDDDGHVTVPGFFTFNNNFPLLARSLIGRSLYDPSVVPSQPVLTGADVEALMDSWVDYQQEGLLGAIPFDGSFDFQSIPLQLQQSFGLFSVEQDAPRAASLLPGGIAGLTVTGFAVSAGTQYPDLSYALLKYMSNNVQIVNGFFDYRPARESLMGVESEDSIALRGILDDEQQAVIEQAFNNAIPLSDLLYVEYLVSALTQMSTTGVDAQAALQDAETRAVTNLQQAADQRADTTVFVATAVPTPVLSSGEVSIKFGYTAFITPLANQDQWDAVIEEFVANDPTVGQVEFETGFGTGLTEMAEQYDCFVLPYNATQGNDINAVLSLDPFLDADFEFDQSDLVGNLLAQMTRDNKVWAYPLTIQPQVLWYNNTEFSESGVPVPQAGWTTDAFADALRSLKLNPDDPAPFVPTSDNGSYLLMLIAAYGGLPLDFRTNPPTINFTSPENVDAIQQVLDLAKDGYIEYSELGSLGGAFFGLGGGSDERIIFNEALNEFSFASRRDAAEAAVEEGETPTDLKLITYPRGSQFVPVAYDIGTAYISATSQNPDACYRWISAMAQHPELFSAMPARRSTVNNPDLIEILGSDVSEIYGQIDAVLQDPSAVEFPAPLGGNASSPGNFLLQLFINRAFDHYVLEDADLAVELSEAETFSKGYIDCTAAIPPFDPAIYQTQAEQIDYFYQFVDCATKVDPSLEGFFPDLRG